MSKQVLSFATLTGRSSKEKNADIKQFTSETLGKCKNILQMRKEKGFT